MINAKAAALLGSALLLAGAVTVAQAESYEQKDSKSSNSYTPSGESTGVPTNAYYVPMSRAPAVAAPERAPVASAATGEDVTSLPSYQAGREREY